MLILFSIDFNMNQQGCFVFQALEQLGVRNTTNVRDEAIIDGLTIEVDDLISVDLIVTSIQKDSINGPFLRLSNGTGWLFKRKYDKTVMKSVNIEDGLWTFYADNFPTGIALRSLPNDRMENISKPEIMFFPMQKIVCDRKVTHPTTGVNFYRVRGTANGWVFDKRGDNFMMIPESKITEGLFVYKALVDVSVRSEPNTSREYSTPLSLNKDELISVNAVRNSPYGSSNGPFLRLTDGSGWLYEKAMNEQILSPIPVTEGMWVLQICNPPYGIKLRKNPMESSELHISDVKYLPDKTVLCDKKIFSSCGAKFFKVYKSDGWIFDKRDDGTIMARETEGPVLNWLTNIVGCCANSA